MSNDEQVISDLADAYEQLVEDSNRISREVDAEYREIKKQVKAERRLDLERAFALKFNVAREMGIPRHKLELPVLRTKNGERFKYFVELAGGELRKVRTASERAEERELNRSEERAESGITHEHGNVYQYEIDPGTVVRLELKSKRGRVHAMPIGSDVTVFRDKFGTDRNVLYELGEKIVELYDAEVPDE